MIPPPSVCAPPASVPFEPRPARVFAVEVARARIPARLRSSLSARGGVRLSASLPSSFFARVRSWGWLALLPGLALFLSSCSLFSTREKVDESPVAEEPPPGTQAGPVGNPLLPNQGDPGAVNYNVSTSEELAKIDNGAEGELFWTNPDNPEEEDPGLTAAFENRRRGNGWLGDLGRGIRLSRREGWPLLIWFHDSVTSPKSRTLGAELLETSAFNEWCRDRVVRVKLDAGASIDERARTSARYSMQSINSLERRYGMTRKPALAVISPRGKVVTRVDGYDGFVAGVELGLKAGVQEAEKEFAAFREQLKERGYREWKSRKGKATVFARLQRFDEKNNIVYLREYGGRVTRTRLENFCADDVDYLDEQARQGRK